MEATIGRVLATVLRPDRGRRYNTGIILYYNNGIIATAMPGPTLEKALYRTRPFDGAGDKYHLFFVVFLGGVTVYFL